MNNTYTYHFKFSIILLLAVVFMFSSCSKGDPTDCFMSTGEDVTEYRSAGNFNKIVLGDNVNLVITQGEEYLINVQGGKNVLKKVETDISNGVLNIANNNSCNWMRSFDREITVHATVKNLNSIIYSGSGDISSTNAITGDSLLLDISEGAGRIDMEIDVHRNYIYYHIGTADVYYKGKTHLSYITASSFGPVHADNLTASFTFINNKGSNNCYVRTSLRLEATIQNLGNIYYYGSPEVILNDTGNGELIKLEDE